LDKILLITTSFVTGKGGTAKYARDFVCAFSDKYNFVVITGDDYSKKENDKFKVYNLELNKLKYSNGKYLLDLIKKEKPSIIINSAARLCSLITPFIPENIKVFSVSHFVNGILAKTAGLNPKYINYVICLSTFGKKFIDRYYKISDKNKSVVIFNFAKDSNSQIEKIKKSSKKNIIVYPGGTAYYKQPIMVLKAIIKLLKTDLDFEFYWLGSENIIGANWPFIKLKTISQILPNDQRIMNIGSVDSNMSKTIISSANIFVLPSKGEGCPLSLIEAMQAGCIPIISDAKHGSLDIIVNKYSGIVVPENNSEILFQNLYDIIINHDTYIDIYNNSKSRFQEMLTENKWVNEMQILFDSSSIIKRLNNYNYLVFLVFLLKFSRMIFFEYIIDRFRQLKQFIAFRYYFKFFLD